MIDLTNLKWGDDCPVCGTKVEMYYRPYCPKCDIQEIIKHKKGTYNLLPILTYGKKFIDGFDKEDVWFYMCDRGMIEGNDTYSEIYFEKSYDDKEVEFNNMMRDVLTALNVDFSDGVLFRVSW